MATTASGAAWRDETLLRHSIAHFENTGVFVPPDEFGRRVDEIVHSGEGGAGCFVGIGRLLGRLLGPTSAVTERAAATVPQKTQRTSTGAKAASKPSVASARLATASEAIDARIAALNAKAGAQRAAARAAMAAADKRGALLALKRAKHLEKQAEVASQSAIVVESQMEALEMSEVQRSVALALSGAVKGMKRGTKGLLDKAETAVEGAQELGDLQNDISAVFSELSTTVQPDLDHDDLEEELLELMAEQPEPGAPEVARASEASLLSGTIDLYPAAPPSGGRAQSRPEEQRLHEALVHPM